MLRPIIASALLSLSAQAAHLDTVCKSALKFPPVFGEGVVLRTTPEYKNVIETFDGTLIYEHSEKMNSVVVQDEKMWVLTYSQLLEMKKDGTLIKSHPVSTNKTMTLAGDLLLIVRSGGTISALNTLSGEIVWTTYMQDVPGGEAVAVAYDGKNAQVAMSTAYENGFTGVATLNPATGEVLKKTPYDVRRVGVIAPDANARWFNEQLFINNMGWIHAISSKQLNGKPMRPKWISHVIPSDSNPHYMMLLGEFFFEGRDIVGCGRYQELVGNSWEMRSALFRVRMP